MEILNFIADLNYWPVILIVLAGLIAFVFTVITTVASDYLQKKDLVRIEEREAVLLKIKKDRNTENYYNRVLLASIERSNNHRCQEHG